MQQVTGEGWTSERGRRAKRAPATASAFDTSPASRPVRSRQRPGRGPIRRWATRFSRAILLASLIVAGTLFIAPARTLFVETFGTPDDIAVAAGFGLDTVVVAGQRFTSDSDIYDCLGLASARTMFALDSLKAKSCIEALPWVAGAGLTRIFPGRLDIVVSERRPFAVWQQADGRNVLVDRTGRLLGPAVAERDVLLKIAGPGAPDAAVALAEALSHVPAIAGRLDRADRMDGRRWSLVLEGNIRIELPAEGEATALADLLRHRHGPALLSQGNSVVDLRSRFEIAARPADRGS